MLTTVLVILVAPILVLLVFAATRPNVFRVERRAHIAATPDVVFSLLDDFHRWMLWSPWEKLDPALKRTYSGAPSGVGAKYEWRGNRKAGHGRMEIVEATRSSRVVVDLQFLEPWKARNTVEFTLTPHGNGTEIVWAMSGPSPFMLKLMGIFMPMDKMVGKDFEAGLASMKAAAESGGR